jgi:hypothetical protein
VAFTVGGWILWALLAVLSVRCLGAWNQVGAARQVMRTQGSALVIGLSLTAFFSISKLHLLWIAFAGLVLPILVVALYNSRIANRYRTLNVESKRSGLPFTELLRRERSKARQR